MDIGGCGWINIGGRGWNDIGGCGWINTGGIRGEAVVEAVVAAVWGIGRGRSAKGCCWDCLLLFSYIYRVRKVIK